MSAGAPAAPPCVCVVFGAAGTLASRLLAPALYNLATAKLLSESFALVGVARKAMTTADFQGALRGALSATAAISSEAVDWLVDRTSYVQGDLDEPRTYESLKAALDEIDRRRGTGGNRLYYLAVPPGVFAVVVGHLGEAGLSREAGGAWRRVVVEKPFGTDLLTARALNSELLRTLAEHQIYRIDHYLGKETVQNLMLLRFGNGLFEPLWNRQHIDHIQITVAETVGVGSRGAFYDATGALRDMVPNHLFQLLTLAAMEPPTRFDADAVRSEKAKVLDAVMRLTPAEAMQNAVRGQYGSGRSGAPPLDAYRRATGVASKSLTETFVALRLTIDNWRWAGVPFYLRTGKAMAARRTEVAVKFKQVPYSMFRDASVGQLAENFLVVRIQPDEGIALQFNAKVPGPHLRAAAVRMDFKYEDYFEAKPNTGYETLLYDCMLGDATLFQRADDIEAGWRVVQPFLDVWREVSPPVFPNYAAGSVGPGAADELLARDGRRWRDIV
jgi:glucose-6-phosphate 1-dehydrogenase